jgi:mRNA interferase MazF
VLVDFNPTTGVEVQKTRPAVVVNVDDIGRLPLRIVVPITDWKPYYADFPWFVYLSPNPSSGLTKACGADGFQVKSVSVDRFRQRLGALTTEQVDDIAAAIALCVGFAL